MSQKFEHVSVLPKEVIDFAPKSTQNILDCTLGGGGHSLALLNRFPDAQLFGMDQDRVALDASSERLADFGERVNLTHACFSETAYHFEKWGNVRFDFVLADIGISSEQLARAERGFSFMQEGPLDMRMDPERQNITAANLVNHSSEHELLKILRSYGEEKFAHKIVRSIIELREEQPFVTTADLANLVARVIPRRFQKQGINPATLTFQALRIAVNNELGELESLLEQIPKLMQAKGRLAIICFHSLEDRIVKQQFRKWANPCECPTDLPYCVCGKKTMGNVLTKRPVNASEVEVAKNPRSRSAHLRVFEFKGECS